MNIEMEKLYKNARTFASHFFFNRSQIKQNIDRIEVNRNSELFRREFINHLNNDLNQLRSELDGATRNQNLIYEVEVQFKILCNHLFHNYLKNNNYYL